MKRSLLLLSVLLISNSFFAANEVIYIWCGGVTSNSVKVNAKLTDTSSTVRLVVAPDSQFNSPQYSTYYTVDTSTNMMVAMGIGGLQASTRYYYAVESGGVIDSSADDIGSFTTFAAGPFSFSFVTGSCCLRSNHGVYEAMRNMDPLFYVCTGDLHYANPNNDTNVYVHRSPYETLVLSQARAAKFFRQVPIEYVWDDHDFCGNDSDSSFVGKKNARKAYREYVPHYPLPAGNGNNAIYQSFTAGRVHFIHTDLRSDRYGTSMMGAQQKAWFKNECISAKNNNEIICWFSSTTWNGGNPDNWGGFQGERNELSNFFRDSAISNMFIVCGDAHMLGIDDGADGDFSTSVSNGALYPIFAAAALNQAGSYKGGIFNVGGIFPNPSSLFGQFGLVTVTDTGGNDICISFTGYRCDSAGLGISYVNYFDFCRTVGPFLNSTEENMQMQNEVSLFPNPSTGKFSISTKGNFQCTSIAVYDAFGRELHPSVKIKPGETEIDLAGYPDGVYFVRLVSGSTSVTRKVLIQH